MVLALLTLIILATGTACTLALLMWQMLSPQQQTFLLNAVFVGGCLLAWFLIREAVWTIREWREKHSGDHSPHGF